MPATLWYAGRGSVRGVGVRGASVVGALVVGVLASAGASEAARCVPVPGSRVCAGTGGHPHGGDKARHPLRLGLRRGGALASVRPPLRPRVDGRSRQQTPKASRTRRAKHTATPPRRPPPSPPPPPARAVPQPVPD